MANSTEKIEYEYTGSVESLKKATSQASKLLSSFENMALKTFKALSGIKLADALASSVKESLNYVENMNLFNVAMGDSVGIGREFVSTMQEIYGMDPSNIMAYVGNFYQLTSAVNATSEASEVMSLQLTKAANDISSLFNVDIDTVINNLSSGLRGMSRAVAKYGMDIRATTLQTTAASLGITRQVETMSEADREGLRYITMMKQASNAMGDFAKTIESPANQLRIFKEQITQLARAIGNFFLPVLQSTLPYINGFIMAVRTMLTYVADLMGITDLDFGGSVSTIQDEADALNSLGSSANSTANKLKELVAPFDELNVLNEKASGTSLDTEGLAMDPKIEEAIKNLQVEFENVRMKANQVRDDLLEFFGFEEVDGKLKFIAKSFKKNLTDKYPEWVKAFENVESGFEKLRGADTSKATSALDSLKTSFSNAFNVIVTWGTDFFDKVLAPLGAFTIETIIPDFFTLLADALQAISDIWEVAGPTVDELFANLIHPLSEVTWELIYSGLSLVVEALEALAAWARNDPESFNAMVSIVVGFLASLWIYNKTKPIISFLNNLKTSFEKLTSANGPLASSFNTLSVSQGLAMAGFTLLAVAVTQIIQNWDKMNGIQKTVSVLGAIAIAAAAAAAAVGALQSAWSLGIAAAAIVAGTVAIAASISAAKRDATKEMQNMGTSPVDVGLATGGVVTGPTRALIGEGAYDEAVVPLGDSPQLNDMLDKFANKVTERPVEVRVFIGDKEWNSFTYKANQKGSVQVGATPLGVF